MAHPEIKIFAPFILSLFVVQTTAQDEPQSPCPGLFLYEGKDSNLNRWYGIVQLLSESDVSYVHLRLIFDSQAVQLGNGFGAVVTSDNKDYVIQKPNHHLKAHVPQTVRFFIKYNPTKPAPKLISFRLNDKTVCPEAANDNQTTKEPELHLNMSLGVEMAPSPMVAAGGGGSKRPEGDGKQRPPASGEDVDINEVCGTVIAQPRPLIMYGEVTHEGQFPWHAAIYITKGVDLSYSCGASLISKYHIITIASCVIKRNLKPPLTLDNFVVYLGKYYLKDFSNPEIQNRQVAQILPHPQYNISNNSNNIALVKFTTPADITDFVRPVCLWQEAPDLSTVLNKQGKVVGWGRDETGKFAKTLMQTTMPIVSQETCLLYYPNFYSRYTSSNTFCAGFIRNGTSLCTGDWGGGMVFSKPGSSRNSPVWQLRGLVSIAPCEESYYAVFTDAAKYLDWVKKSIK